MTRLVISLAIFLISFSFWIHAASASEAQCPIKNIVYTDGVYELVFDKSNPSVTMLDFKMIHLTDQAFIKGKIIYGNGYSIPNISIEYPPENETNKFHRYDGGLYEIDGERTRYAFEVGYNERNPILFPKLNKFFYYARNQSSKKITDIPKDVWVFKECRS